MIDNLAFTQKPGSNQFLRVADNAPAEFAQKGFKPTAGAQNNDYTYDNVGNQTNDPHKGITSITYNYLNLPSVINWANGNKIELLYDAAGMKLSKKVSIGSTEQYTQHYLGGIEYTGTGSTRKLEAIYFADGRVYNTNVTTTSSTVALRYEYAIRDHLGNTRLMFADLDNQGTISLNEVLQENHYYPFGMNMEGVWMNDAGSKDNKYAYNGKELNEDYGLNWSDYGARWYDAAVGRWNGIDVLAEKYISASPYLYVLASPLLLIDPDGKNTVFFDENGNKLYESVDDAPHAIVVIQSKYVKDFNKELKSRGENSHGDIALLRSFGDTYFMDEVIWALKISENYLTTDHNWYDANDLSKPKPLQPEIAFDFKVKEYDDKAVLRVDISSFRSDNHPSLSPLGSGGAPKLHTHPPPGWQEGLMLYDEQDKTYRSATGSPGPSPQDDHSQSSRKHRFFDVVIDRVNIYLYRLDVTDPIKVGVDFFQKSNKK
jgi:RHS repeat-associated protein